MVQIPLQSKAKNIFISDERPILLYAGQISEEPTWSFPCHKHDELSEIIYISEGEGRFIIDGQTYIGRQGDILVYNRGVLHEEWSDPERPLKTYFCGVGHTRIDGVEEGCIIPYGTKPVIHAGPYSHQIEQYISGIFEELRGGVFGFEEVCRNTLASLIILILRIVSSSREVDQPSAKGNPLAAKIKDYIDSNYYREIPLTEIANRLYISPYYLSRIFKEEVGFSPINYVIQRRIGEAKKLLLTTDMTVQQIAGQVGYDNAHYFSHLFKKVAGQSPSDFRKTQLVN